MMKIKNKAGKINKKIILKQIERNKEEFKSKRVKKIELFGSILKGNQKKKRRNMPDYEEKIGVNRYLLENLIEIFGNNLISVVIFGSRARKNYDEYSDLDLLVVVENYGKTEDIGKLSINFSGTYSLSLDIHVVSKQDVLDNFRDFSPMYSTFVLGVKIIFDRDMFFRNIFYNFIRDIQKINIKYVEGGKIWELNKIAANL